jgi:hypothetical protein
MSCSGGFLLRHWWVALTSCGGPGGHWRMVARGGSTVFQLGLQMVGPRLHHDASVPLPKANRCVLAIAFSVHTDLASLSGVLPCLCTSHNEPSAVACCRATPRQYWMCPGVLMSRCWPPATAGARWWCGKGTLCRQRQLPGTADKMPGSAARSGGCWAGLAESLPLDLHAARSRYRSAATAALHL